MSYRRLDGLDVSYPFGAFEGTALEDNIKALRLLLELEHFAYGSHGLGLVARWRGLATISDDAVPRVLFASQIQWPQASATVRRLGVGRWSFVFGNTPLFAAAAEVVAPSSTVYAPVAHVAVQDYAPGAFFSFEVHTQTGNSTTLDYMDLPFALTVYSVQTAQPLSVALMTEDGDTLTTEDGDALGE